MLCQKVMSVSIRQKNRFVLHHWLKHTFVSHQTALNIVVISWFVLKYHKANGYKINITRYKHGLSHRRSAIKNYVWYIEMYLLTRSAENASIWDIWLHNWYKYLNKIKHSRTFFLWHFKVHEMNWSGIVNTFLILIQLIYNFLENYMRKHWKAE